MLGLKTLITCCWTFQSLAWVHVNDMTLEEKVGQLFMVPFLGKESNQDAKRLIQDIHVGGIIYYTWSNALDSPQQVRTLSENLQKLADQTHLKIPLFIATDQEGGRVIRLKEGFTHFPGNRSIAQTKLPELARKAALATGIELMSVGINMNLAPVVDINSNPQNPVIGIRSFGNTPDTVIKYAAQALLGFNDAMIISSLKHFPGHGDVNIDSHEDLPTIQKPIDQLRVCEFSPFYQLAPLADTIMTAHIKIPSIDSENCATLSPSILGLLREDAHFEGVIVSDSLNMEAVLKNCNDSIEEAAIRALNAGCDILLFGGRRLNGSSLKLELTIQDIKQIHRALVLAVQSGRISLERLNEAVERIVNLKSKFLLDIQPNDRINDWSEHQNLAKMIADLSIECYRKEPIPLISESRVTLLAPLSYKKSFEATEFIHAGKTTSCFFYFRIPNLNEIDFNETDLIIICTDNAWKIPAQIETIQSIIAMQKPVIIVALGDPLDALLFSQAQVVLTTFSPTLYSIQAAFEWIKNFDQKMFTNVVK